MAQRQLWLVLGLMWTAFLAGAAAVYVSFDRELALVFATILILSPACCVAGAMFLVTVHETAHAVVGRLVGFDVVAVVLGRGRSITRFQIGSIAVDVRVRLVGGATICMPSDKRLRYGAFVAAGVAAEALISVGLLAWQPDSLVGLIVRTTLLAVALLDISFNLLPTSVDIGALGAVPTDGAQLLALLLGRPIPLPTIDRASVLELVAVSRAVDANDFDRAVDLARALHESDTDRAEWAAHYGWTLLGARRWREGYDLLAALANKPEGDPLLANNAAFAAVMSFNDDLLTDADRLSTIAFAQMPTVPAVCNTRAAVLIELGRPADALPLLKVALRSQLRAPDRAIVLGFSAIAHHDLGDERAAAKQRRAMVHFDASCPLDDEVKRRLALPPGQASRSASPQWSAPTAGTATH